MTARKALFLVAPSPEAAGAISGWLDAGHAISEIWLGRPRNRGIIHRDARLAFLAPGWSVSGIARKHGITLREVPPLSGWTEGVGIARATGADVLVSCMFSFRVPEEILALFGERAVNLHPAPLPEYRGPHATYALLLDGSIGTKGCVTLHVMEAGFDTGAIIASDSFSVPETDSMKDFSLRCGRAGYRLAADLLPKYLDRELTAVAQDEARVGYPRMRAGQLAIGPHIDLKTARRMFAMLGSLSGLNVSGIAAARAAKLSSVIGPPSGQPPKLRLIAIESDVADARIRMRRDMPWGSAVRKIARLVDVISAPSPRS